MTSKCFNGSYAMLDDLVSCTSDVKVLTQHGIGKGGGELVAESLALAWGIPHSSRITHKSGIWDVLLNVIRSSSRGRVMCTAGPRDIPVITLLSFMGQRPYVYLQVPFIKSITWKDPLHLITVLIYLFLLLFLAKRIFVNSTETAKSIIFRNVTIILPIWRADFLKIAKRHNKQRKRWQSDWNIVCRLTRERGRGSRDLCGIKRLAIEIAEWNRSSNRKVVFHHFGDCSLDIMTDLSVKSEGGIVFHGFTPNWLSLSNGPIVLLSLYEGFGLAAFEAAVDGRDVYVNEAFPFDLIDICKTIHQVRSSDLDWSILKQLLEDE